jgi:hypothetical protein
VINSLTLFSFLNINRPYQIQTPLAGSSPADLGSKLANTSRSMNGYFAQIHFERNKRILVVNKKITGLFIFRK